MFIESSEIENKARIDKRAFRGKMRIVIKLMPEWQEGDEPRESAQ